MTHIILMHISSCSINSLPVLHLGIISFDEAIYELWFTTVHKQHRILLPTWQIHNTHHYSISFCSIKSLQVLYPYLFIGSVSSPFSPRAIYQYYSAPVGPVSAMIYSDKLPVIAVWLKCVSLWYRHTRVFVNLDYIDSDNIDSHWSDWMCMIVKLITSFSS